MWILLIIILFLFLFEYSTRSYINPYKLTMVFGKKGSGKSTFLTKTAIKAIKKGHTVYSTIPIPGTILFDVNHIGKYSFVPDSLVLIDEIGMIWDNRDFKNFKPEVRDFFKLQRHWKVKVVCCSQVYNDIDLKLRVLFDELYLLSNFGRVFSVCRRIDKRLTIHKGEDGKESSIVDDYTFAPLLSAGALKITFIPRWVSYFDSFDIKPLPFINGRLVPLNEVQTNNLKTSKWLKKSIVDWLHKIGNYFLKLKTVIKK